MGDRALDIHVPCRCLALALREQPLKCMTLIRQFYGLQHGLAQL